MIDTPIWNKIGSVLDDDLSGKIRPAGNAKGRRELSGWGNSRMMRNEF